MRHGDDVVFERHEGSSTTQKDTDEIEEDTEWT